VLAKISANEVAFSEMEKFRTSSEGIADRIFQ